MSPRFQDFHFALTYQFAGDIRDEVFLRPDNGWLAYLEDFFVLDDDFERKAVAPQKATFLHGVIDFYVDESLGYMVEKNDYHDSADTLARVLTAFGEAIPPYLSDVPGDEWSRGKVDDLHGMVRTLCHGRIVDEIFTMLFADRPFLRELNECIAESVVAGRQIDRPRLFQRDGVVRRCTYWPTWLCDALYYRDKGRCAMCLRDISGLLAAGREQHVDHIVPLALGGTNDPTNLQYLCPDCNSKKGASTATSGKVSLYW